MTLVEEGGIGDGFGHTPIEPSPHEPGVVISPDTFNKFEVQARERIVFPDTPLFEGNNQILEPSKVLLPFENVIRLGLPAQKETSQRPVPFESLQGLPLKQRNSRRLRRV